MKLDDILHPKNLDERRADPVALAVRTGKIYGKEKDYGYDKSETIPGEYIPLKSFDDDLVDDMEEAVYQSLKKIGQAQGITNDTRAVRAKAEEIAGKTGTVAIDKLIATQPFVRIEDKEQLKQKVDSTKTIYVAKYNSQYFIRDGHHAVLAASLRGERFITAMIVDFDFLMKRFPNEQRYTANEWAIISGGHSLEEETVPKNKLFDFGKY